ncbi:N-acetylmuramoyl-L-alanine amidase [Bosea sp. NPDC055594]
MDTTALQRALIAHGHPLPRFGADGHFGGETRTALQAFQLRTGLRVTERPDAATIAALQAVPAKRPPAPTGPAVKLPAFPKPTTRRIEEIIVHCTATPEGRPVSVNTIRGWHIGQGWRDIGYHWVVLLDGTIAPGRPESQVGSHVAGHNSGTLGVVYVGGVGADGKTPKDTRTPAQKTALLELCRALIQRYPAIRKVTGHNQYSSKACPSFDVRKDDLGRLI